MVTAVVTGDVAGTLTDARGWRNATVQLSSRLIACRHIPRYRVRRPRCAKIRNNCCVDCSTPQSPRPRPTSAYPGSCRRDQSDARSSLVPGRHRLQWHERSSSTGAGRSKASSSRVTGMPSIAATSRSWRRPTRCPTRQDSMQRGGYSIMSATSAKTISSSA